MKRMEMKTSSLSSIQGIVDFIDWISKNPEEALRLAAILTFLGLGIVGAVAISQRRFQL